MSQPPASPPTLRHEIKFALDEAATRDLELWLRTSSLGLRTAHQGRLVHNLYFDTLEADSLADKLAGLSDRAKVRYRWYGDRTAPDVGQLEVKRRANGLGWKETYRVDAAPSATSRAAFVRALRAAVPPRARAWLATYPEPMLINRYRRAYFASCGSEVRATVDRDLSVWDQRVGRFPQCAQAASMPRLTILELKFAPTDRARVATELSDLGFVASACSKYELGVRAISG